MKDSTISKKYIVRFLEKGREREYPVSSAYFETQKEALEFTEEFNKTQHTDGCYLPMYRAEFIGEKEEEIEG